MSSVTFDTIPVYSILADGRLYQRTTFTQSIEGSKYVGGKIFYIDETSTGATYTFYSSTGKIIEDIQVGDEPYAYTVSGTPSKFKYYVFDNNAVLNRRWTYNSGTSESPVWVYEDLGTTRESVVEVASMGNGKTNTDILLAKSEYTTPTDTLWYTINSLNSSLNKGCNDWYCPSRKELETIRLAVDRNGNKLTNLFKQRYIWSSTELSAQYAWLWYCTFQRWSSYYKNYYNALVPARGF